MIPVNYDETLKWNEFMALQTGYKFEEYSKFILMDAIDSIARVWLRVWQRYLDWMKL
ncbi:MAG TPA: hypothetical protein PKH79_10950 [Prolixibacteraceae bacterium]|nr:hypothetical protein [Prolixibacteraceae bacterium]